jgi:predicted amidohydrolase YtcJ
MISATVLAPELILHNGVVHTLDDDRPAASAVAVKDGRILVVGQDAEVTPLAGAGTETIDLGGRTVIPGLFDSHAHLQEVGLKLSMIRLDECRSAEEMLELVRERAARTPRGEWIVGTGWNEGNFLNGQLPTRHDIDAATADHPVILMRFFNMDLVNSYALRLANVTRRTPDPADGRIERDPDGEPNGLLRAKAKILVRGLVPRPTLSQLLEAVRLGCREFNRFGITSVLDPGLYPWEMHAYQAAYEAGLLSVRLNVMPSWHGFREEEQESVLDGRASELGIYTGLGDEWLRIGGLKMAIDGGTSSHTACMYEPFEGEPEVKSFNRLDTADLRRHFRRAAELGWDAGIHCCGDRAQDMAVEAMAYAADATGRSDRRNSIIHAYFPTDRALDLMARYRIAAVIQPTFLYWEGDMIFRDVGQTRALNYKPARNYLDRGVILAASSDVASTVSANPFVSLYALVTRKNNLGHHVAADQAITRDEALRAYTTAGAWLTREERLKGTITPGKLADLAVLDRDYFAVPDEELRSIEAEMTFVGGKLVWQRSA